ncbi:MAG: hypothetical protein A2033_15990 [Bacteroidetes bacterium GWA2_31_9]|nr:MAG: hypothetical protein A2033_15990 [Bacteroidetes bacterium GWA2_31_9]
MKSTIFYSWQSDLENSTNRTFLKDCISDAIRSINKKNKYQYELVIDEATKREPGTPGIADTILNKIDNCKVFICDISTINSDSENRKTPNPNVLIEAGYAIKSLGWNRVICIINNHYGSVDSVPFDLKHRRIFQYSLEKNDSQKKNIARTFINNIESAIENIIDTISNIEINIDFAYSKNQQNLGSNLEFNVENIVPCSKDDFLNSLKPEDIGYKSPSDNKRLIFSIKTNNNDWNSYLIELYKEKINLQNRKTGIAYIQSVGTYDNRLYFEQALDYYSFTKNIRPFNLCISNNGNKTASNIEIEMIVDKHFNLQLFDEKTFPNKPKSSTFPIISSSSIDSHYDIWIKETIEKYIIQCVFLNVQPHKTCFSENCFYILSKSNSNIILNTKIYADNITPIEKEMKISFNVLERPITKGEIINLNKLIPL